MHTIPKQMHSRKKRFYMKLGRLEIDTNHNATEMVSEEYLLDSWRRCFHHFVFTDN